MLYMHRAVPAGFGLTGGADPLLREYGRIGITPVRRKREPNASHHITVAGHARIVPSSEHWTAAAAESTKRPKAVRMMIRAHATCRMILKGTNWEEMGPWS